MSVETASLAVEIGILGLTAPVLLFSTQFPGWVAVSALLALIGGWLWRRMRLGYAYTPTAIDLPLALLFGVMLPVSIWAAPDALRMGLSVPRALVMAWSFSLYWTVVTYASRQYALFLLLVSGFAGAGAAVAMLALLGTQWLYKFPGAEALLTALPTPLQGAFAGAEAGFHPNQVAGTLLYVFPLLLAILAVKIITRHSGAHALESWMLWLMGLSAILCGVVLLLVQSRSALVGLAAGVLLMLLVNYRWGRIALTALVILFVLALPFASTQMLDVISDAPTVEALGGARSVEHFRSILWVQAVRAISDFPLTGMGLGTFRELARVLYPLEIPPAYDIGHAHNFFLQTALDFGLPGMIAVIAMILIASVQLVGLWRWSVFNSRDGDVDAVPVKPGRIFAIGFAGCLVAQTVYSMLDAVAMGAKTNFMFWYLLALIMGLANYAAVSREGGA